MNIKNILLSIVTAFTLFTGLITSTDVSAKEVSNASNKCSQVQSNNLKVNQTELFYMYSNKEGHFFLDPKAETENVIFVGLNDFKTDKNFTIDTTTLHHGKKFIGTFADDGLWELIKIEEVK
ncbi:MULTISPECIES: hypothetical protein [Lysinibacillus]|uniref:hypothetical protein n=1 Tax=Lysinibacillus TaxID=400634 RepID=UPI00214CFE1B|nr:MULTISPECIES: hypothetical protein [Lysinibacillus]UUV25888.1 hypothetical protein NP781_04530 [Lysinibacillus sp. FN11]UYB48761.1 hypothetical protein OCI51_07320 [Lysinibacillus capsici]